MQKYEGIHFYINIKNFDAVIIDEEKNLEMLHTQFMH